MKTAEAARSQGPRGPRKSPADATAAVVGIAVAQSDLVHAEALLAYTRIVAPFDGIITLRNVHTGDLTIPGNQGEPLFVVVRSDLLTLALGVPEMNAPKVKPGSAVSIRIDASPGSLLEGRVARTSHALDARSRTLCAEIDLPDPKQVLQPGLYANATITLEQHKDALCLPTTALVRVAEKVFCVQIKDRRACSAPDPGRARGRDVDRGPEWTVWRRGHREGKRGLDL